MRIILQESSQPVEIRAGLNEADDCHQGIRIDEGVERHVRQIELSRAGDQHAVELVFHQRPIGADTELAAEDNIKGVGQGTGAS